ncbi:MAG: sensor histidine kinase N-terminal domain-containing protein [Halocynthiibacter sp.]
MTKPMTDVAKSKKKPGILRPSGSIRRRLTLQLVGSAALLAAILFMLVQSLARQVAEESQISILFASATSITDAIGVSGEEITVDIPYSALSMLGNVSDDRVFYRVSVDGVFLTGYANLPLPENEPDESGGQYLTAPYRGEDIRLVATRRTISIDGQPREVTVAVAQTLSGQAQVLAEISRTAAFAGVGFFIFAAGLAIAAAQGAVRPLKRLAMSVSRRGPKDLRPVITPAPSEMLPLVIALNRFMERLAASLSRSEEFIAGAAHRGRTPLATVRAQAEVALRRVERPENKKALREMIRAVDESSRSAGQLLDHAAVTFRADHLEDALFDLCDLTRDTVDRLHPLAELRDIQISLSSAKPALMRGDAILVQSALRNLLDNAIKYSPPDSRVSVEVRQRDANVFVRIWDQGEGFAAGSENILKTRFSRGPNVGHIVGSGLGLTIAEDVAQAHGGSLTLTSNQPGSSEGQGACVTLSFPSA